MMEHFQYYDGLDPYDLAYHYRWLVVCNEAAYYCEHEHIDHIGYSRLRSRCDSFLHGLTKLEFGMPSSSFKTAVDRCESEGFFTVEREVGKDKDETRIIPNIPLIQKVGKNIKLESLGSRNKNRLRLIDSDTTLVHHKHVFDSVSVSDRSFEPRL